MARADPIGVYVHVPFCRVKCPYCSFSSNVVSEPPWPQLLHGMVSELQTRAVAFATPGDRTRVRSVYFGGGTPSLAPCSFFGEILAAVRRCFTVADDAEITVEANPDTVGEAWLQGLRTLGVNRVSLGMQSTHDRLLAWLGRTHDHAAALAAYRVVREAGFDNTSLDLIFGVPGQSLDDLHADLSAVVQLAPEHISVYELTYHRDTPLHARMQADAFVPTDETQLLAMMDTLHDRLDAAGYEHYEVSNYAQPGRRAVHNSLYWNGTPYLGIGPGAHSFQRRGWDVGWRWESRRDPMGYIRVWGESPSQPAARVSQRAGEEAGLPVIGDAAADPTVQGSEQLDAEQLFCERMMCGLRVRDGVHLAHDVPPSLRGRALKSAQEAVARGWAQRQGDRLAPTDLGLRFADSLAALFF